MSLLLDIGCSTDLSVLRFFMAVVQIMVCFWVSALYDFFFVMVFRRNTLPFSVG
jgi:hypothetical protein